MARDVQRRYRGWSGFWALVIILAATACAARGDALPADDIPTASPTLQATSPAPPPATSTPQPTPTRTPLPPTATPTPEPTPTATPIATATHTATPTATPAPALRRLTTGGCCTQPFWLPDSQQVLFIDKPSPDAPLGIWGVALTPPQATAELLTERIAFYTADLSYVIKRSTNETAIERLDGPLGETVGERWTLPAGGRSVSISPGMTRIAWQVSDDNVPYERRISEVWVANFDGADARPVATLPRGGLSGWISDDVLLLSGWESLDSRETVVYSFSLSDGATVELLRANRPRGYALSPDRRWLAYYISLDDDPAQNGLWLARTDGTEQRQLAPELFGAYQWRDARRLLVIPYRPEAVYHEVMGIRRRDRPGAPPDRSRRHAFQDRQWRLARVAGRRPRGFCRARGSQYLGADVERVVKFALTRG